jgi:murein DD-endopeptidase MepM/ murein hydrolase activator NlpD
MNPAELNTGWITKGATIFITPNLILNVMTSQAANAKIHEHANRVSLSVESRIHGDVYVRFGGRLSETYRSNAVRRRVPSLHYVFDVEKKDSIKTLLLTFWKSEEDPVIFPARNPCISSGFGKRKHPIYKRQIFHTGIDFAETKGTPVYATGNGIVTRKS